MTYVIKSLDELNDVDFERFSGLEKISFDLPEGMHVNSSATDKVDSILKQVNEELGECGCTWGLGSVFGSVPLSGGLSAVVVQYADLPWYAYAIGIFGSLVIGGAGGIHVGKQRARKRGYRMFSELRDMINDAYGQRGEGAYRRNLPILQE